MAKGGAADFLPEKRSKAAHVTATGHPSAVLRARDDASRTRLMRELVADLGKVAVVLGR